MSAAALKVMALEASLDPADLLRREPRVRVHGGRLYLSTEGLSLLLPPGVKLERIVPGALRVRLGAGLLSAAAQIRASVSGEGYLRLEIGGLAGLFLPFAREQLAGKPGVKSVEGSRITLDLAEAVAQKAPVELPPLRAARIGDGVVELEF